MRQQHLSLAYCPLSVVQHPQPARQRWQLWSSLATVVHDGDIWVYWHRMVKVKRAWHQMVQQFCHCAKHTCCEIKRVATPWHATTRASKVVATVLKPQLASRVGNRIPQNSPRVRDIPEGRLDGFDLLTERQQAPKGQDEPRDLFGRVVQCTLIMATGPRATLYQCTLQGPAQTGDGG